MHFKKSKKSAIFLSVIIVLSFSLTTAIVDILIPLLFDSYEHSPASNAGITVEPGNILGIALLISIILLVLITIGAFWLYRFFGERHFGRRSAIRWILFGVIFAILLQAFDLVFQENLPIIKGILQFLSVFAAYFISRFIIPLESRTKKM